MISVWEFILLGLAAFRITRLIVFDKITEFLRAPFFREVEETGPEGKKTVYLVPYEKGIRKWAGELLDCYWCTGIWISIGLVMFYHFFPEPTFWFVLVFAVAAIAAIIETVISYILD